MTISASCFWLGAGALLYHAHYPFQPSKTKVIFQTHPQGQHYLQTKEGEQSISFNLHSPFASTSQDRDMVLLGYELMLHTRKHAGAYMGEENTLSCVNCHFCAGNTTGGKNGSISLVGVVCNYPSYSERDHRTLTLEDRIQNCFMRSLNGKALPKDSQQMQAFIHYLDWISQDVRHFKKIPWLGLRMLKSSHVPDPVNGETCYAEMCAPCHGDDGAGSKQAPALWGDHSFNDGAGMNTLPRLSAFIYDNMPYENANLTVEQAFDISAYLMKQPRPHFVPPEKTTTDKAVEKTSEKVNKGISET